MIIDGKTVAGTGTTALGIIGTVLGGAALAMGGSGLLNNLGTTTANTNGMAFENTPTCMHDLDVAKELAQKDSQIAKLQSDAYTDSAKAAMKDYTDQAIITIYKELKSDVNTIKTDAASANAAQAVINANLTGAISALQGQEETTANLVASITKTAVPKSAICNFGCSGCSGD